MNARIITVFLRTTAAVAALLLAAGCVAQVGQPEEKTGTIRSTLGNGDPGDPPPDPGTGGDQSAGDKNTSDPGNNSTSGDNQGPQPLPWTTTGTSPSGNSEQKK